MFHFGAGSFAASSHADPLALQLLDAITSGNSLPCPTNFTTRSDCRIARHYKWSIEAAFHRFNSPGVNAESAENWVGWMFSREETEADTV